jgi:hypothetical protein
LNLPISRKSFSSGISPASDAFDALTITITRMSCTSSSAPVPGRNLVEGSAPDGRPEGLRYERRALIGALSISRSGTAGIDIRAS